MANVPPPSPPPQKKKKKKKRLIIRTYTRIKEDRTCCISPNRLLPVHESWHITPRDTDVIAKAHILNEIFKILPRETKQN